MYIVKALINFNDYEGKEIEEGNKHKERKIDEIFECSKERFEYLQSNNAVELVEIKQKEIEVKKTAKKSAKKSK